MIYLDLDVLPLYNKGIYISQIYDSLRKSKENIFAFVVADRKSFSTVIESYPWESFPRLLCKETEHCLNGLRKKCHLKSLIPIYLWIYSLFICTISNMDSKFPLTGHRICHVEDLRLTL